MESIFEIVESQDVFEEFCNWYVNNNGEYYWTKENNTFSHLYDRVTKKKIATQKLTNGYDHYFILREEIILWENSQ